MLVTQAGLFQVLALRGSYHGDTLGAMEAQAPSAYTGFLQQPWYEQFVTKACAETLQIYFFCIL
jgi:adenosylmethionine-8-amino-7-oxononanoate aminotransferase